MKDIIVGVDRPETARETTRRAAELAAASRTNLHPVMCVERGSTHDLVVGNDCFHTDRLSDAELFFADVARSLPHEDITHTVGLGDPAKVLCKEASRLDARAIVVGNGGVQGVSLVLGSVAADVTRLSPCGVMVANTCGSSGSRV